MLSVGAACAQDKATADGATQSPEFEVATIKPHSAGDPVSTTDWRGGTFQARNVTVKGLIEEAFSMPPDQVSGGPAWVEKQRFDVTGKIPVEVWEQMKGLSIFNQMKPINKMLQTLMRDRFHLVISHQPRELPVYALVQARGGAKLLPHGSPKPADPPGTGDKGFMMAMDMEDAPVSSLANFLASVLGKTVLDQTGLRGNFDIRWTATHPDESPADERDTSIFRALEDQLGLKLVSKKATVDTIQIEKLEEPSEN